jgi:hypothetical protein
MNRKRDRVGLDRRWLGLDGGFSGYLTIDENGHQAILTHQWVWGTQDPVFELSSRPRDLTYWDREIPTPQQQAGELLEERGNSYNQGE